MAIAIILPKSGMGITEATITEWLKCEGDKVNQGEVIAEVETAKASLEIEAPVSGVLVKIIVPVGEDAEVNSEIGLIEGINE